MKIITPKLLEDISCNNKKLFEQLFPELLKQLILNTNTSVKECRFPSGDNVWAPGYDGVVCCEKESQYVCRGNSVWELGTNKDALSKINSDYDKRTQNSLGYNKKETGFYLVMSKIWAYNISIHEWENQHNDWKFVKVYDAEELCDWLNKEPVICAWLLEKVYGDKNLDFSTVNMAWDKFAKKTNPQFVTEMFTLCRENEKEEFLNQLNNRTDDIKIKADTMIDSIGFVLSILSSEEKFSENCIVVNNVESFKRIATLTRDKIILLNYVHQGEIYNSKNRIILCFNKEASSINNAIELPALTKSSYELSLKKMGISEGEIPDLFAFTHGNLRALIRRKQGNVVEKYPDWANKECLDALVPLVLLRNINKEDDKKLVEYLANMDFKNIEKIYYSLAQMEDSPLKLVYDNYVIINYEEAWATLKLTPLEYHFDLLINLIIELFNAFIKTGEFEGRHFSEYDDIIRRLFWNLIYYSYEKDENGKLEIAIKKILSMSYKEPVTKFILDNLSFLAISKPEIVMNFISEDYTKENGIIKSIFKDNDYQNMYCKVLFALDKLALYQETIFEACRILFDFFLLNKKYAYSNSPENSLLLALCLWRNEGTVTILQKEKIIMCFLHKYPKEAIVIFAKLIGKHDCIKSVQIGEKEILGEPISLYDFNNAKEKIMKALLDESIKLKSASSILCLIKNYRDISPKTLLSYTEKFILKSYDESEVFELNYWLREEVFKICNFNWEKEKDYEEGLEKWISLTEFDDELKNSKWIFKNSFYCPAKELLKINESDNYNIYNQKKFEYRKKIFINLFGKFGDSTIDMIVNSISDENSWGYFLVDIIPIEKIQYTSKKLLDKEKFNVLARFIDEVNIDESKQFVLKMSNFKERIIPLLTNKELLPYLSEKDLTLFWSNKEMYNYNKEEYDELLKYNPKGLISYLYLESKKNPIQCINIAIEVFNALLNVEIESNNKDIDLIKTIIEYIDKVFYSDTWTLTSKKILEKYECNAYSKGYCKYLFNNPRKIKDILNGKGLERYIFKENFYLPDEAYNDYSLFKSFFDYLRENESESKIINSVIGSILGKYVIGVDGFYPHDYVRKLLEEYDSYDIDNAIVLSFENLNRMRTVTDGNDQKQLKEKYKDMSLTFTMEYPHSAYVLKNISLRYGYNEKSDYVSSELM